MQRLGGRQPSVNDLIRAQQERRRDGQAERFGRLPIDHQLDLRRLLTARGAV